MGRDALDRYYTDGRLALACIDWLSAAYGAPDRLLEPCSGGGAFGRAAAQVWSGVEVLGCDIDPAADPGYPCEQVAVADWEPAHGPRTWIVTNPHYQGIYDTVATMRRLQDHVRAERLALLLRETTIGHLMACGDPPHAVVVSPIRPRWGGPGGALYQSSDTCGSALAVWGRGPRQWRSSELHALPAWRLKGQP